MSFLIRDFPGTDSYQGDLGWIICKIKEFQGLADTIEELQSALDNLPQSIHDEVENQLNPYIIQINNTLSNFENHIVNAENAVSDMRQQIMTLTEWISKILGFIENYTDLVGERVFQHLKQYIDAWSKDLPPVTCPVDGNMEPISVALEHLYLFYNNGITAGDYDGLQITANDYDSLKISAGKYDAYGSWLFEQVFSCTMISPFTGEREKISVVADMLADLHKKGITASEYDALNMSAENYDAVEITAYEYDWNNTLKI